MVANEKLNDIAEYWLTHFLIQTWRVAARDGLDTDSLSSNIQDFDEETVEFLVDTKETIIVEWSIPSHRVFLHSSSCGSFLGVETALH